MISGDGLHAPQRKDAPHLSTAPPPAGALKLERSPCDINLPTYTSAPIPAFAIFLFHSNLHM